MRRDQIQAARPALGLDESLSQVPGVFVSNRYNYAQGIRISVRGFGARAAFGVRGLRLIEDGIPLTMPDGQSTLNNIDLSASSRIEVLRGASSMLHGNAAGGVIEIHSEQPAAGFSAEVRGVAGDLGRDHVDNLGRLNVKLAGGSQDTRYLVDAARLHSDGFRNYSQVDQSNLNARLEHSFGARASTTVTINYYDSPFAEDPGALPRDSALLKPQMAWPRNIAIGAGKSSHQLQAGIEQKLMLGQAVFDATLYGLRRGLDNPQTFAYIMIDRSAGGVRSTLSWPHVTLGIDVDGMADKRREFDNANGRPGPTLHRDQTDRVSTVGPFVRATIDVLKHAALTAGVRYDRASFSVTDRFLADGRDDSGSRILSSLSPAAGINYQLSESATAFAGISTSFQTPTTTELNNTPPPAGQPCCPAGLNSLKPERALAYDAGVRGSLLAHRLSFDVSVFLIRIRDKIVPFQVDNADGRDFYRNAGRTRQAGLEVAASTRLTPGAAVTASYTYSHFIFEDDGLPASHFEGNLLPGVPPHHLLVYLSFTALPVALEPEFEWISSYYADDANTPQGRNNGVRIWNLRSHLARPWAGALSPFLAIDNIFNARYNSSVVINAAGGRFFEPAPGRNLYIGMSVRAGRGGLSE